MIFITKKTGLKNEYPYHIIDDVVYDSAGEVADIGDYNFVLGEQFYFQSGLDLIDNIPKLLYRSGYLIYLTDGFVRKVAESVFLREMFLDIEIMKDFETFDTQNKKTWVKDKEDII